MRPYSSGRIDNLLGGLWLNLNPTKYLDVGIQAVCMNDLVDDDNMKIYKKRVNCSGFIPQLNSVEPN